MFTYFSLRILITLALIAASYGVSRLLLFALQRYVTLKVWVPKYFKVRIHFNSSLFWVFLTIGLKATLPFFQFRPLIDERLQAVSGIALILSATWLASRVVSLIKISAYLRLDVARADNLRERKLRTQVQFIEKIVLAFIYVIAAAMVLRNFEGVRQFGSSLIASAGLAGVILGFAAQKSLTNLIAGFQIAFTQPVRIDDVVIVENEWGRIEEITFTYVVIRLWDKRTLIVPITYFLEKPFQNWTRASADLIGTVMIYVDYKMPLKPLREQFAQILSECPLWDGKVSVVQLTDITHSEIEIRFLAGARNASEAFDLRCIVREHLIAFIQREYPDCFPQRRLLTPAIPFRDRRGDQDDSYLRTLNGI